MPEYVTALTRKKFKIKSGKLLSSFMEMVTCFIIFKIKIFLVGIIKKIEYNIGRYGYLRLRLIPALVKDVEG